MISVVHARDSNCGDAFLERSHSPDGNTYEDAPHTNLLTLNLPLNVGEKDESK